MNQCLLRSIQSLHLVIPKEAVRRFSVTTVVAGYGSKWRFAKGESKQGNRYGVLTDTPDYTFLDGRPTPLSKGQMKRREENIDLAKKTMKLLSEIDFAKDRYKRKQQEVHTKHTLKEKGEKLLSNRRRIKYKE